MSQLIDAIRKRDREAARRAFEADPASAEHEDGGVSAVLWAAYYGDRELARAIAARKRETTIFEAATLGDVGRVRALLARDRALANATSSDGYSPVGLAAFFKQTAVARELIASGADVRAPSRDQGFTPLHSAVADDAGKSDAELVRMLLEAGADPNARNRSDGTPLHTAAFTGDRAAVELLLAHGADPHLEHDGKTAIEIATERGHPDVAELLEPGARA